VIRLQKPEADAALRAMIEDSGDVRRGLQLPGKAPQHVPAFIEASGVQPGDSVGPAAVERTTAIAGSNEARQSGPFRQTI
jgi:hypothetical protein